MSGNGNGEEGVSGEGPEREEHASPLDGCLGGEGLGRSPEIPAIAAKIQEIHKAIAEKMDSARAEFEVGGGQVKAMCNVSGTFLKFDIDPGLLTTENKAFLEAFLVSVANGVLAVAAKEAGDLRRDGLKEIMVGVLGEILKGDLGAMFGMLGKPPDEGGPECTG